ncbi:ribonuclease H-like domain-containing protein [Brassicibacter mesophilus]|uniref:ribonuclease H-like domain-containing protein n=1 Tax=Brassicibacter mesophilus TaxID=745119 RepID=UPI003D1D4B03
MDIVLSKTQQKINIPDNLIEVLSNKNFCFFDIETTGFNRNNDYIILIGVLYCENDFLVIKQYFAESLSEEYELLASFSEFISKFDIFINYNGDAFDIPFINTKLAKYNIEFKIDANKSLDLMKIVRSNKNLLELSNYKLKTVEKLLGINREDTITGKESVDLYNRYLSSNDKVLKKAILKHNHDDIFYLPKLLKIYDLISSKNSIKFNVMCMQSNVVISLDLRNISFKGAMAYITGYTGQLNFSDQIHYGDLYMFEWQPSLGIFKLRIELCEGKLSNGNRCLYLNGDDYVSSLVNHDILDYNIPSNIIIIKDKNKLMNNNIKMLVKETLVYIFSNI